MTHTDSKTTIGFDAKRITHNGTGLGNYGRNLVNALAPLLATTSELVLYSPSPGRDNLRRQVDDAPGVRFAYPRNTAVPFGKSLWRTFGITRDLRRDGVALFHGLTGELPAGLRRTGIKGLVTIHDLIFMRHPEYYNPIDVAIYKWKFALACREADRMIAISERTKADIMELGGFPEERIDVVYQSCGTRFGTPVSAEQTSDVRHRYSLPSRYILNVGTIERRKNVCLAIAALPSLPQDVHLVIVGRPTEYAKEAALAAIKHGVADRTHMLHGVPNADLPAIYRMAEAFVYPSRYEGFGIPVIEAIQSGLPVVAAKGSCLEEAGGPDCTYVSPDDPEAMASAILRTLRGADGREHRLALSRDYVRRFENTDVARKVAAIYERMLGTTLL